MKTVPLYGAKAAGRVALVDDEDYELVMQYRWRVWEKRRPSGTIDGPYAVAGLPSEHRWGARVKMHKLLTGWPMTDHRNGDGLDNQRSNLRPTTKARNNHNQSPQHGTSSQFKGVTWHKKAGKWQAAIKVNGKNRYLGVFTSEEAAACAYADAALAVQGEHAYAAREVTGGAA